MSNEKQAPGNQTDPTAQKDASPATIHANNEVLRSPPFTNNPDASSGESDFKDAGRGFIDTLTPLVVHDKSGQAVWDMTTYAFEGLNDKAPDTVNPSLWRMAQLNTNYNGLFAVDDKSPNPSFFQVRGFDLSNMTIIETNSGILVIDPLISSECASAALALYRKNRDPKGERAVKAIIYTHSHVDHFGGVEGVISKEQARRQRIPIIAPEGFLEHAVSENLYAGKAMTRRAQYMYGAYLARGPKGQIDAGLGKTQSTGSVTLIAPTVDVSSTGQEITVDGMHIVFQVTPGTEAPSEMNFFFPDHDVMCAAENATHNLHNILTLRGAQVRDALTWSKYLNQAIDIFGKKTNVLFAQHHWPCWGRENIHDFLSKQRDMYRYLHDQTLRYLNKGHIGIDIAETMKLPASLQKEWYCRDYYGTISHNVKAIYQRYMGWFEGNPDELWKLPAVESSPKYVEVMGGAANVIASAKAAYERGEYRWVAELLKHVVWADKHNYEARYLQADALEQIGYQVESGPWRNFYLMGAYELRQEDTPKTAVEKQQLGSDSVAEAMTLEQLFDTIGISLKAEDAEGATIAINWNFTNEENGICSSLIENSAISFLNDALNESPDAAVTIDRNVFIFLLSGKTTVEKAKQEGLMKILGSERAVIDFFNLIDRKLNAHFPIVTPQPLPEQ